MKNEREQLEMLLCRYLDGDVTDRERADIESMLERDTAVRADLEAYRSLDARLQRLDEADLASLEVPDIDYELQRGHIMEAVERRALLTAPLRKRFFMFRPVYVAVAAAAMVLILASAGFKAYLDGTSRAVSPGPVGAREGVAVNVLKPAEGQVNVAVLPSNAGTVQVEYSRVDMMDLPLGESSDTLSSAALPPGTIAASVDKPLRPARKSPNGGAMGPMTFVE